MSVRTRADLRADLEAIGLRAGDVVMVHAAIRRIGALQDRGRTLVGALLDAVGSGGTVMAYTDWDGRPPFDPCTSPAIADNGALPQLVRTTPGAIRSGNPGASMAAVGARAEWLTADHPLDYGYGPGSPLAKLVEAGGKVLMIGAPLDAMTLLHHAEHLADIPGKHLIRSEVTIGAVTHAVEEFDTSRPVVDGLDDDYFATIVRDFLATDQGAQGHVGDAPSVLVDAAAILTFAVAWLERANPGGRAGRACGP